MSEEDVVVVPKTEAELQTGAAAAATAYREKFAASLETPEGTPTPKADEPKDDDPVKPEHVPEKFWDAKTGVVNYEGWSTAHTALETQFHNKDKDKEPKLDSEGKPIPADDKPAADDPSKEVLETPAATKAAANYAENGKLEDSDYTALEAQGISRDMADSYIAGKEAAADKINNAAYEPAGGKEQYETMVAWAAENLDETSKTAFNSQLATGDAAVISAAVASLKAVYSETETIEGDRQGGGPTSGNSGTFASRTEMTAAMNKIGEDGRRQYDVDPAYRNEVIRKIGNSRRAKTFQF